MKRYVLDTNVVSLMLRNNPQIRLRFRSIVSNDDLLIGCPLVWHEIHRGLLAKNAHAQLTRFHALFSRFEWQNYGREDWHLAAQLWAQRRNSGKPIQDADLLIAAFSLRRGAILVTANEKDFVDLGLTIENWEKEAE